MTPRFPAYVEAPRRRRPATTHQRAHFVAFYVADTCWHVNSLVCAVAKARAHLQAEINHQECAMTYCKEGEILAHQQRRRHQPQQAQLHAAHSIFRNHIHKSLVDGSYAHLCGCRYTIFQKNSPASSTHLQAPRRRRTAAGLAAVLQGCEQARGVHSAVGQLRHDEALRIRCSDVAVQQRWQDGVVQEKARREGVEGCH